MTAPVTVPARSRIHRPLRWPRSFIALCHYNFRVFLSGAFVGNVGAWVRATALNWFVLDLTGSTFLLGLVTFAMTLPVLLLALPAGVLADRFNRRRLLVVTQGLLFLLTLGLALLIVTDRVAVWRLLALPTLMGIVIAFNEPAWQSFIKDLVRKDHLTNAIALNSAQFNLSRVLGPALAGILIAAIGVSLSFLLNALAYVAVLGALALLRLRDITPTPVRRSLWSEVGEGFRYIRDEPTLRVIILLTGVLTIFGFPYAILMPVMAREALGLDASGYGQLMAATGVGAFASAVTLASLGGQLPFGRVLLVSKVGFAGCLGAFALTRAFPLALVSLAVLGFSMIAYMTTANTVLQTKTPEELRGRVMSIWTLTTFRLTPFGSLQAGALASLIGAPWTLALGAGVCLAAVAVAATLTPTLRAR